MPRLGAPDTFVRVGHAEGVMMPSRDTSHDPSKVVRLPVPPDTGAVTMTREADLLREIARMLAREAAREAFDRALAAQSESATEGVE